MTGGMASIPFASVPRSAQEKFTEAVAGVNTVAIALPAVPAVLAVTVKEWLTNVPAVTSGFAVVAVL